MTNGTHPPEYYAAQAETEAQAIRAAVPGSRPIVIAPSTLRWAFASVMAVLALMPNGFADRYLKPAAQSELDQWVKVVQVLQQGQKEIADTVGKLQRDTVEMVGKVSTSVERVTVAVDNLSGIVTELKNAPKQAVRAVTPKAGR